MGRACRFGSEGGGIAIAEGAAAPRLGVAAPGKQAPRRRSGPRAEAGDGEAGVLACGEGWRARGAAAAALRGRHRARGCPRAERGPSGALRARGGAARAHLHGAADVLVQPRRLGVGLEGARIEEGLGDVELRGPGGGGVGFAGCGRGRHGRRQAARAGLGSSWGARPTSYRRWMSLWTPPILAWLPLDLLYLRGGGGRRQRRVRGGQSGRAARGPRAGPGTWTSRSPILGSILLL